VLALLSLVLVFLLCFLLFFFVFFSYIFAKFLVELFQSKIGERWQTLAAVPAQISVPGHFGLFAASHQEATVKYLMRYVNNLFVICD